MSDDLTIRIGALLDLIQESLLDHAPGPMPEHDPLCRTYSGWPEDREKGCNCSVARNVEARAAVLRIRKALADSGAAE